MKKKWTKRIGIALPLSLMVIMCLSVVVYAVGSITDLKGQPTDTTISLTWIKSVNSENTTIRYSTSSYPTIPTDGLSVYSGAGSYYTLTGLTAGTNYYFCAWSYNGTVYSTVPRQLFVTTLAPNTENTTIPYSPPMIPANAWQNPDTSGWSIHPIDDIIAYFADPLYAHGGLGMPTNNLTMFIFGLIITGISLLAYIKWHNFFAAYTLLFIGSAFGYAISMMQWWVIGLEILIGAGVWAVEKNFQ